MNTPKVPPIIQPVPLKRKHKWFYYACLIISLACIVGYVSYLSLEALVNHFWMPPDLPKDADLIEEFHQKRSELEQLKKMLETEKKLIFVNEFKKFYTRDPLDEAGVTGDRLNQYQQLLNSVSHRNASVGYNYYQHGFIMIGVFSPHSSFHDRSHRHPEYISFGHPGLLTGPLLQSMGRNTNPVSKGFAYCRRPPSPIRTLLDDDRILRGNYIPSGLHRGTNYRHIEGDWYLYLDL